MRMSRIVGITLLCMVLGADIGMGAEGGASPVDGTALDSCTQVAAGPARRIDRRHDRRQIRRWAVGLTMIALPVDVECTKVIVNGVPYWRCDNEYFVEKVEDGTTVYVVVEDP